MPDQPIQPLDPRGLRILLRYYRGLPGGPNLKDEPLTQVDLEYAKLTGFMPASVFLTHDEMMHRLLRAVAGTKRGDVTNAFLFSLSSSRVDYRSALGSFAVFQHFELHSSPQSKRPCSYCGEYLNHPYAQSLSALNFARHKRGGWNHDAPAYAILDLESFRDLQVVQPSSDDVQIFKDIVDAVDAAPPKTTSTALQKYLAPILKSNKSERDTLVAILGFCGIIATPEHPGYAARFVECHQRLTPPSHFMEMKYPACWWKRPNGINREALHYWFGHLL